MMLYSTRMDRSQKHHKRGAEYIQAQVAVSEANSLVSLTDFSMQKISKPVGSMIEDESKTMKLFHKLAPGHHHKDAPEKEEVRKEEASLSEQTDHIHAHTPHPVVESYVPGPLALQTFRVSRQDNMATAECLQLRCWHPHCDDPQTEVLMSAALNLAASGEGSLAALTPHSRLELARA